ncbi:hypothetical protein [Planktothricoides sp. SR001]|uniref:hypothetical protein n=1 Tax=Planktothricoides sp. SR001 TaxID=1705388 RepID=UPI0012E0E572|nr:hypothetical protein [Planktothricoides sp. SR001]
MQLFRAGISYIKADSQMLRPCPLPWDVGCGVRNRVSRKFGVGGDNFGQKPGFSS